MKIIIIEYFVKDMGFLGVGQFLVADLNIFIIEVNIYLGFSLACIFHLTVIHRTRVFSERIVDGAQPSWLSLKGNERDRSISLTNRFVQNVVRTNSGTRSDSKAYHWCSYHISTSSEISLLTDVRQHGIYLFCIIKKQKMLISSLCLSSNWSQIKINKILV